MDMNHKFTFVDILCAIIAVFMLVVASPFVMRQFIGISKVGDILWNVSLDVVILSVFLLLLYTINRLLNRF